MHKKLLFGLLGFAVLTILFTSCRVVDASTLPKNPKVQMGQSNFLTSTVTISKGQSIDLIDTVSSNHVILNGRWNGSTQEPKKEANAPDVNVTISAAGQSKTVGPFSTAGTFNIYCNVHQGMNLTITVK
jgi:plastocyanin